MIPAERLRELAAGATLYGHERNEIAAELLAARERIAALNGEVRRMTEWFDAIADTIPGDAAGPHYGVVEWHRKVLADRDNAREQVRNMLAKLREELGKDLGAGGGFVEILVGIDGLREQRNIARAARDEFALRLANLRQALEAERDAAIRDRNEFAATELERWLRDWNLGEDDDVTLAGFIAARAAELRAGGAS